MTNNPDDALTLDLMRATITALSRSARCTRCDGDRGNAGGACCELCGGTGIEPNATDKIRALEAHVAALSAEKEIYEEGLRLWDAKEEEFKAQIHRANLGIIAERTERDNRVVEMSNRIDRLEHENEQLHILLATYDS